MTSLQLLDLGKILIFLNKTQNTQTVRDMVKLTTSEFKTTWQRFQSGRLYHFKGYENRRFKT